MFFRNSFLNLYNGATNQSAVLMNATGVAASQFLVSLYNAMIDY